MLSTVQMVGVLLEFTGLLAPSARLPGIGPQISRRLEIRLSFTTRRGGGPPAASLNVQDAAQAPAVLCGTPGSFPALWRPPGRALRRRSTQPLMQGSTVAANLPTMGNLKTTPHRPCRKRRGLALSDALSNSVRATASGGQFHHQAAAGRLANIK